MDIFSAFSLSFVLSLILFIVAVIITFYLPGRLVLLPFVSMKLNIGVETLVATVIGIVLWGFQAYIFGYLHVRWLSYIYILLIIFISIIHRSEIKQALFGCYHSIRKNNIAVIVITIGSLLQLFQVFGSGLLYTEGIKFFGIHRYDGVMHLAYIQGIIREFPPQEPGLFGTALINYHYWSDMIIADFIRVWNVIPIHHAFFQFFPLLISVLTGVAAYLLVQVWGWSKKVGHWSLFFLYLGGDATYLLIWLFHQKLNFTTPVIDSGATQFFNMPTAMAKLIFLTALIPFDYWIRTKKFLLGVVVVLMFASLAGVKVYFGIFALFGFLLVIAIITFDLVLKFYKDRDLSHLTKKLTPHIVLSLIFIVVVGVIYLPANRGAGGLVYSPLEWPKNFLRPEVLDFESWFLRMQVYEESGNYRNVIILNIIAICISLICIHGTRLIGLIPYRGMYKRLGWEKVVFMFPGIIIFHILGLTTLQASGGLNVFNFFVVSTVMMSLFAAIIISQFLTHKSVIRTGFVVLIVVITIPRVLFETYHMTANYLWFHEDTTILSQDVIDSFEYIRKHTDKNAVVQSHPENDYDRQTPYIAYFSNRPTYISGNSLLLTHNKKIDQRVDDRLHLFEADNTQEFVNRAKKLNISIIYVEKKVQQKLKFTPDDNLLENIFENNEVVIYQLTGR